MSHQLQGRFLTQAGILLALILGLLTTFSQGGCVVKQKANSAGKFVTDVGKDASKLTARTGVALGLLPPPPEDYITHAFKLPLQPETLRTTFNFEEENEIGAALALHLAGKEGFYTNDAIQRYMTMVATALVAYSEAPTRPLRVLLTQEESRYAYGLPGGYLLVSLGALRLIQSESELAGLLGKCLAHVMYRHVLQLWEAVYAQQGHTQTTDTLRGLDTHSFGILTGAVAGNLKFPGFSETQHSQADRYATDLLTRLGYEPGGLKIYYTRERVTLRAENASENIERIKLIERQESVIAERLTQLHAPTVGRNLSDRYRRSCMALLPAPRK